MNALRSVLLYLWWSVTVVPWAVAAMLASVFVRGTPLYRFCTAWLTVALPGARAIMGISTRVTGQQHVPEGPAVFLVKHQSAWETLVLPRFVPQPLSFVLKRQILFIPFFGWTLGRLDMIHIDRDRRTAAYVRVLRQGQRFLAQGNGVVMFPEGTRMPRGAHGTYQSGGARLAIGAGVPVVPVAVASARCWPKGWIKRPGVVDISFGPPIASDGKRPEQLTREAADWIEAEMRRIDPQAYPAEAVAADAYGSAARDVLPERAKR
ncbi:MAG: 1-acyl-sn-glycerol-3-phosphate acyltransferase [Burkholderiaceae bacterium]|jgi:1-acyl-sn-glycerol-3-phosphate acyltransferase|nr:1-acyl-sn-glycerol-3-phosphate acyltransferase [Burkholderiaceae bacterium]